jgi:hypothetical protein
VVVFRQYKKERRNAMTNVQLPNGVTLLHVEAKDHNCRYEVAVALGPLVESLGTGSIVRCSCGVKFKRDGELETGYYWADIEE